MSLLKQSGEVPVIARAEPNPAWLELCTEEVIEPDLAIVDPHHHVSDGHWGGYLEDELLKDLGSGHRILSTVYIQCGYGYRETGPNAFRALGETQKIVALAASVQQKTKAQPLNVCEAIVAYADLSLGEEVEAVLEGQMEVGMGRVRGIRCSAARHPAFQYGMLTQPPLHLYQDIAFRKGFACLARYGLSFESWAFHSQMDELYALAKDHPDTVIVINHLGAPVGVGPYKNRRAEVFADWSRSLCNLASCPNTYIKLGGLGMTIFGFDFHQRDLPPSSLELAQAWRPYIEEALEVFGPDRCMFESNFPVDKGTCSYRVLWNTFKRISRDMSLTEKAQLFRETAANVYRLSV